MNGLSESEVAEVLGRLASAQASARDSADLPFSISCLAYEGSGKCDPGARAALANLDLAGATTVTPVYVSTCIRVHFEYPADRCPPGTDPQDRSIDHYVVGFGGPGGGFRWRAGLRPAGTAHVDAIELEYTLVTAGAPPVPASPS